ncbi:MAG: ABC transporter ATP-binding protein/permease, partial [Oscillospiraceae bacterium]|nr:ABC transporter ATP-binding protein/permease [Oscillospiraceae bacterium]
IRQMLFSLMMLSNILMQSIIAGISTGRINEVLDEEIDIKDLSTDANLSLLDGSIEFKDVNFSYSKHSANLVLQEIDFKIESGQTIGIIGGTGAGKSSLVQLIPRLYEVTSGQLVIGGHDIKEYPLNNLRKDVAMVLQKNILFSGTIMENLRWGDEDATDEMVYEACRRAQADTFVRGLPDGYETLLGQGGVNLSGGQQQRLCIARALLKNPKIMILDDSTSAVDTDTDSRIRAAFKESLSHMTTIIIAQRIVSVVDADLIIVMDDGKIQEIGNHRKLLESNEIYKELYTTQLQGVV